MKPFQALGRVLLLVLLLNGGTQCRPIQGKSNYNSPLEPDRTPLLEILIHKLCRAKSLHAIKLKIRNT